MAYFPYYYSFNANDRHNQELLDETFSIATGSELGSIYSVFDDIPQSSTSQVPSQFTEDNYSGQQQHYQQQYQEQYQQQDPQQYKQQHQQLLDPQQQQINIPRSVSMPPQTQQRTFPFIIEPCTLKKRTSMSDSDRKFVCPVCNHRSKRRHNLVEHMQTHDPNRPKDFACRFCNRAFARKYDMKRHEKIHNR